MTGGSCEIGVDTVDACYRNYGEESSILPPDRVRVRYTDFRDFREAAKEDGVAAWLEEHIL